jgi:hypothetical protein
MSRYAFKAGVYFPISGIGITKWNKARIVEFFDKLDCVPEDYDPDNIDEEETLYFEEEINKFHPRHIYIDDINMWIIEYIMAWDYDDSGCNDKEQEFAADVSTLESIAYTVSERLGISTRPVAFAYQWYTGTDEPFITPPKPDLSEYDAYIY